MIDLLIFLKKTHLENKLEKKSSHLCVVSLGS